MSWSRNAIPHPGNRIAYPHEVNLKLLAFYLKYLKMTSRSLAIDNITLQSIMSIKDFKTISEKRIDPSSSYYFRFKTTKMRSPKVI